MEHSQGLEATDGLPEPREWRLAPTAPWLILLATFLSALAIRLMGLGMKSFWSDEGASWANAIEPIQVIFGGQDIHPPGYYLLLHVVTFFSETEIALRLPSAVAAAAAAALVLAIAWRYMGAAAALLAGALSVVSPLDIWYAQDARQPALAACAVLIGAYGLVRKDRVGYIIAGTALILGLLIDYVALAGWAVFGGAWTYMCWRSERKQVLAWAMITAPILAAFVILLGNRFEGGTQYLGASSRDWYGLVLSSPLLRSAPGIFLLIYLLAISAVWVYRAIASRFETPTLWLLVVGLLLATIAMAVPRAYSLKKILIVGWPLPILLTSYRLATPQLTIPRKWAAATLLVASIAAASVGLFINPKEDWRSVSAEIEQKSLPGEMVWVSDVPWAADTYFYYGGDLEVGFAEDPPTILSTSKPTGVWVVAARWPRDPVPSLPAEAWFDANWILVEERAYDRLALKHYLPPPTSD